MTRSNSLKSAALAFALAIACVAQASAAEPTTQEKMPAQAAVVHAAVGAQARVLNGYDYEGHTWSQRCQERDPWGHRGDYYGPMLSLP
jgi:hypothetical protein